MSSLERSDAYAAIRDAEKDHNRGAIFTIDAVAESIIIHCRRPALNAG